MEKRANKERASQVGGEKYNIKNITSIIIVIILLIIAGITITVLTRNNEGIEQRHLLTETIKKLSKTYTKPGTYKIIAEKPEWQEDGTANVKIQIVGDLPEGANPQYAIKGQENWQNYNAETDNIVTGIKGKQAIAVKVYNEKTKITKTNYIWIKKEKSNDPNPGVLEGEGTEENPYLICSIEDLVALSYNTNTLGNKYTGCYFELPTSLDFERDGSYVDSDRTILQVGENIIYGSETNKVPLKEYLNTVGFMPIDNIYNVHIDGKNNKIANLYINNPDTNNIGLFSGFIRDDYSKDDFGIKNLTTTGKIEIGEGYTGAYENSIGRKYSNIGGIVNYADTNSLINCHSSVEISVKNVPDVTFTIRRFNK